MSGVGDYSSAGDKLWTAVMQNEVEAHGNPQGKKWRSVSKQTVACDSCKDSGATVLLRCGHEKCPREYHVDCAFHQGGLSLDDNGVLNVFCESHFKPLVFCSCKEAYDDARPMVFCDECFDWFHNKCEGLTANEAATMDKYTCKNCRDILKQGRTVSKVIKDKNVLKESRSVHQQSASKAIGLLSELEGGLCPIIDEINTKGKSQWSIRDIEDAKSVVCAPPFMSLGDATMSDLDAQSAELLNKLGVMPVVDEWRGQLVQYLGNYQQWFDDARAYSRAQIASIGPRFDKAQIACVDEMRRGLVALSDRAVALFEGTPRDLEGFSIFVDCVNWLAEFLQVLHQDPKPDNWIPSLGSFLRSGAARYKHLVAHSKDFFCGAFAEPFQIIHKAASAQVAAMSAWYNETYKILSADLDYSLLELDAYLRSADEFPALPLLHEELSTVVAEAWAVEEEIVKALADPASSAQLLGEITVKKSELGISLPAEQKLNAASERHVFLQAYAMAIQQERLRSELVLGLVMQAERLLVPAKDANSKSVVDSSVLYVALGQQVKDVVTFLQGALDAAAVVVNELTEHLESHSNVRDGVQLARLRALKVITPEEELLEFIQTARSLQAEAARTIPTLSSLAEDDSVAESDNASVESEQATEWVSLSAVQSLVEKIEVTLKNTVVDRFDLSHRHKTALGKLHTTLVDQQVAAERLWAVVVNAVQDCERGVAVTQGLLLEAVVRANDSRIRKEEVAQRAAQLLQRARQEEARLLDTLNGIRDASEESVHSARSILEAAHYLPLTAATAQSIAQRCTVCTAVFESQRILTQSNSVNSAALSEREMHTLRELSHTINNLSTAKLIDVESDMLMAVKEPILLFLWRAEVHFLWQHPIAPSAAELIRTHGEELGEAAKSCREWAELNAEVDRSATFLKAAEILIAEVEQAKASSVEDPASFDLASGSLEERLRVLVMEDATLRIKTLSISTTLSESLELLATIRAAQAALVAVRREMMSTTSAAQPVADFKEITYFVNKLSSLVEKHPSFKYVGALREQMSSIHSAAAQWNESTSNLLPQKATRNKLKSEANHLTLPQLLTRLAEPIARAVSTPMHEKFKLLLSDVSAFRTAFMTFLLPPDFPLKDSSNFQSPDFSAKLQQDTITISEMKRQAELIPLDLPEFRVLQWVSALFEWIHSIPYPGDDPKLHAIPMDVAVKKIQESEPIVGTIPGNVIETLCQLGAMNLDEAAGPVGFHARIHPFFNLAGDLSDHLEHQVKHSEQLQLRIKQAIDTKSPAKELVQLQEESAALLVQLSVTIRRSLDRTLSKSGGRAGAQRGSAQDESESSEYSGAEEEEEPEVDNYWNEKTVFKPKSSTKRARDATADSLVSVKRAAPAAEKKVEDKPKKSKTNCSNPECPTTALKARHSLYCSNHCAMVTASQVFSALMSYRKQLCLYGCAQKRLLTVEDPNNTLSKVSDADWKAYYTNAPTVNEGMADIVAGMKSAGFIAESLNPSRPNPRTGDPLEIFLQNSERDVQSQSNGPPVSDTGNTADRKTSYIHSFLSALPPAAGPVFLRGDAEGLAAHTAAVNASGATPVSVKNNGASSNAIDEDLRLKIRYGLEELLERSLSRLQVAGAANHAAFIALDFEDELCLKYATAESKAASKKGLVFDKKEYRKHYLMLVSNLRKAHNDQLILKLVSNEISVESLLDMTAVQLADSSTQQRRQQQLTNVVLDALRESTQETLEAARRQVMGAGTEEGAETRAVVSAQADSDSQRMSLSLSVGSVEIDLPSPKHSLRPEAVKVEHEMDVVGDSDYVDESPRATNRSLQIEQKVSAAAASPRVSVSGATPKRPIDADAVSRFTTSSFKPNKQPRIESADGSESSPSHRTVPTESPRGKPTALLGSILSNKAAVAAATASPRSATNTTGFHYEDISAASLRGSSGVKSSLTKLINSAGGNEISIVRPGHGSSTKNIVMKGEALVADRKLQGILSTPCNIDGRVKLDEFKRIINKVLTILEDPRSANLPNKKHISVFKMTVQADALKDGSTSYEHFSSEFTRDLRVGYSNLGGGNSQLYVLPPAHKNCLPIFACLEESSDSADQNILYGVLTSKDVGPEQYTGEGVSEGGFSWDTPSLAPPIATSSSGSGIAMGVPPPPAPPSVPKVAKPSTTVAPPVPPRAPTVSAPAAVTIAPAVPSPAPPVAPKPVEDPIQRVATFVATRGIQMMRELQAKPETRSVMPFLFDGHPDHSKFLIALKTAMEQKNAAK